MQRLGLLSDLHGDLEALDAALRLFDRLKCDRLLCAGDLVDTGPSPDAVLGRLAERGVVCVRGNHDRWALARGAARGVGAVDDAGRVLTGDSTLFLASLPPRWGERIEGFRVALVHASPRSDMEGFDPKGATEGDARVWLDAASADVLILGHTHAPFQWLSPPARRILNPGSVLRHAPDRPTSGTCATLDLPSLAFAVHSLR